jgi:glycosyltransferase involved in cell wall biosynthesis
MKVCMFVLDNCKRDSRVLKEAKTLTDAGHDVRIIAVLDKYTEPYEEKDGFRIIRVALAPVNLRAVRAIMRAGDYAARSVSRPVVWAYHLARGRFTRSARKVEQLPGSASREGREPPTTASHRVEQPSASALYRVGQLISASGEAARAHLYWLLRTINRPFNRAFYLRDYWHRSWMAIKDQPADIYHSHDLSTLPVGYTASRRTGGKLVYDSHEIFTTLHYIPRVQRLIFRLLERRLIRRADAVITVNEFFARELSRRYGVALPIVVRNCPPLARQGDGQPNSSLREHLGLDDAVPIIVHVGIFSRSRGSEKLVSATPFLNHGVVVFLGWGAGVEEGDLKELVRQRGLEDRVLFAPPVAPNQVVAHITSAQVGVIPLRNVSLNHYYNNPNKLWECMSAGLPVVTSNFPALKSVVEGYHFGRTCDPEDPEDIAAAINWVLGNKKRYEKMKANALNAAKIFNWENESRKLLEVYRRLSLRADDGTT